jgi:hypothetical protein
MKTLTNKGECCAAFVLMVLNIGFTVKMHLTTAVGDAATNTARPGSKQL